MKTVVEAFGEYRRQIEADPPKLPANTIRLHNTIQNTLLGHFESVEWADVIATRLVVAINEHLPEIET